jgi:hypothetical protein
MNIIGKFDSKPNSYHIGKGHESWAYNLVKNSSESQIVQSWLKSLHGEQEVIASNSILPERHIDKSDFSILIQLRKELNLSRLELYGISAKSGTTDMAGQIYRGDIKAACAMGFIPDEATDPLLFQIHEQWLTARKDLVTISNLDSSEMESWYKSKWDYIKEVTIFGSKKTTQASALLLSSLSYDIMKSELLVDKTVMIHKKQILEDLQILSNVNDVKVNLNNRGKVVSGIIEIQRAGGSNGGKGAEDWQARINRSKYIKWIEENRPETVWVNKV